MTYGVDYSRGGFVSPQTLIAVDRPMVFRYAVSDLSPQGRGITPAEYAGFTNDGIEVGLYWEGSESWMLGGYDAGARAATDFALNLERMGAPAAMPGYFAHDIDPEPAHFAAIDACLNGARSVLGSWDRVGGYGGWLLMDYLAGGGTITRLAQTSAWEYGRGIHPAACLYQYGYNAYFDGVNCDLIVALKDDFGQASRYLHPAPPPVPVPLYQSINFPAWFARANERAVPSRARDEDGNDWFPQRFRAAAVDDAVPHVEPHPDAPAAGPHVPKGTKIDVLWALESTADDDHQWFANNQGYWRASSFSPAIELPHARKRKRAA